MNADEVVIAYSDMVYRIALSYTRNKEDAEDAYSETFLRLFKKERTFESEEHRKAWLIRVTINCAKQILMDRPDYNELNDEIEAAPDKGVSREEGIDLSAAIEKLKPDYKAAIEMYYYEGMSVSQIAEIMDKPQNTVKSYLMRARETLKGFLQE